MRDARMVAAMLLATGTLLVGTAFAQGSQSTPSKTSGQSSAPVAAGKAMAADDKDVKTAQEALKAKGYDPGPIDGILGPRTSSALRAFQKSEGLSETGHLDSGTRDKLGVKG